MNPKRSNEQIKLHNLKGELNFLVRLKPSFKTRADFLIDSIERCLQGREKEMHDKIKNTIHKEHEQIRISQITG